MAEPTLLGTVSRGRAAVHLERTLSAGIATVWAAWTDPAQISRWLGPVTSGRPGPGGTFVLRMDTGEVATCTVTRWVPPRLLELVWDYTGEGPSRLRVALTEVAGGTRLVLDHDRITGADPADYGAGWHVELDLLAAHLAGAAQPDFGTRFAELRPGYRNAATDD